MLATPCEMERRRAAGSWEHFLGPKAGVRGRFKTELDDTAHMLQESGEYAMWDRSRSRLEGARKHGHHHDAVPSVTTG
jgi:hypothetical protein